MKNAKFYEKKLEGLKIIRRHLMEIDRVYGDLVKLEDTQPDGDSDAEYAKLITMVDNLSIHVDEHIFAAEAMVEFGNPKP